MGHSCEWIIMIIIVKLLLFCHHRKNPDYDDYHGQAACVLVVTNVYREGGGDIAGLRSTHTQTRANYQHHHHQDHFQQNHFLKQVKGCSTFCFHIICPYYHQFFLSLLKSNWPEGKKFLTFKPLITNGVKFRPNIAMHCCALSILSYGL